MKLKDWLLISGIFSIFVLIAFFSTVVLQQKKEEYIPRGSTYNAKPGGCKAFYLYLKAIGFDARRWQVPLRRLKTERGQGQVMVVIDVWGLPQGGYPEAGQQRFFELFNWVRGGNTLLLIGNSPYVKNDILNTEFLSPEPQSFPFQSIVAEEDSSENIITATPHLPTIYCLGVGNIQLSQYNRVQCKRGNRVVHFQDTEGQIVTSFREGRGKVVLISDPFVVSNQGIVRDGNIYLLRNILFTEARSGVVYFDEFDHGYRVERGLFHYFKGTSLAWVFLQFLLVGGVYVFSQGKHFGRPMALTFPKKRSVLEYVSAMAGIYQKAQTHQLGLVGIYRRYKALWLKALGSEANWNVEDFSRTIAKKINRSYKDIQRVFGECEEALAGKSISKEGALSLARELEKIRKELSDVGIH
ncbi:MAG: DUF4350 domain-containing protein [Candidatus Omnitrophota bacterium]|nr:MAG: DUF4350 domain-containing protein [Candidatus Omnitrophota bacterium]